MNEISITEGLGFIAGNWWSLLPAILLITFNASWICSYLLGGCYRYVNRSKEAPWKYWESLAKMTMGKSWTGKLDRDGDHVIDREEIPFLYALVSTPSYIMKSSLHSDMFLYWSIFLPFLAAIIGGLLHILPSIVAYLAVSAWGTLFVARAAVDAGKKASEVLTALNEHKADKEAHKEGI